MSSSRRPNTAMLWTGRLLICFGVLALGYVGWAFLDSKVSQSYQASRFHQALNSQKASVDNGEHVAASSTSAEGQDTQENRRMAAQEGTPLGQLGIRAIGLEVVILEGNEDETLRRSVGHIPGTAMPGEGGNIGIAGHRDTFFRPLRNIEINDEITLTTLKAMHRYRVASTQVVEPENVGVLDDSKDAILTLVTCYPFTFVGSAPQRFIVRAQKISP
jgi:sortase A